MLLLSQQVAERIASSSIGFGNPVRARGTPGTIAAQSAALRQVRTCAGSPFVTAVLAAAWGQAGHDCASASRVLLL